MSQPKRKFNGDRSRPRRGLERMPEAAGPAGSPAYGGGPRPAGAAPPHYRGEPSEVELFGRTPFTYGAQPRYYGTGVAGYQSGPGFTGGYYGYGGGPFEIPTELEREYAYDVYGEGPDPDWDPAAAAHQPRNHLLAGTRPRLARVPKRVRKYPPGPKGYQRSDQRMREDICDELMKTGHIDSSEVTVEVTAAKAILAGTVPERWMKHAIEDLADHCPGVQDVENRICVKAASSAAYPHP